MDLQDYANVAMKYDFYLPRVENAVKPLRRNRFHGESDAAGAKLF